MKHGTTKFHLKLASKKRFLDNYYELCKEAINTLLKEFHESIGWSYYLNYTVWLNSIKTYYISKMFLRAALEYNQACMVRIDLPAA